MADDRTKVSGVTTLCFEPSVLDVFILCDNDITWLIIEQRSVALPSFASSRPFSDLSEQDIPIGFCRAFNLSGICHRFKCNWQHKCCNCLGSNHGVINCSQSLSLPFRRAPGSSFKRPGFANTKHNKTSNGRSGPGAEFGKGK